MMWFYLSLTTRAQRRHKLKRKLISCFLFGAPLLMLLALGNAYGEVKVGDEAPSFTLPSSQDKLVDYYADYYGKHHLILTFFPAAFTPV